MARYQQVWSLHREGWPGHAIARRLGHRHRLSGDHRLIDAARAKGTLKRGANAAHVVLDEAMVSTEQATDLVALDEALLELNKIDERKSRVVELRYFGGLSLEETAEVLEVSVMTVRRDWRAAKAWLYRAVTANDS